MAETFQPATADSYIQSNNPTTNSGSSETIVLYTSSGGETKWRGILKFDVSALIPPSSDIASAKLNLYYSSFPTGDDPVGSSITAYKVRRTDWVEGEVTWNNYKSGSAWGTAGASNTTTDIDTSKTGTGTVPASAGWIEIDVTNIVKDAIDNVSDIAHILVQWTNESPGVIHHINCHSSNYTGGASLKPKIVINLTPNTTTTTETVTMTESVIVNTSSIILDAVSTTESELLSKPLSITNQSKNNAAITNQPKT